MSDLIYRQDAIEGICKEWCGCDEDRIKRCNADPYRGEYDEEYDSDKFHCDGCDDVVVIRELPSAQHDLIAKIQNGIISTYDENDSYSRGVRNGMRWCMAVVYKMGEHTVIKGEEDEFTD